MFTRWSEALADAGGVAAQHRGSLERVHLCDHATHGEEEYQCLDESQCEPLPGKRPCRASRPAIAAQAPADPALPRPHVQARQVPITQFGIQRMIIGLALAAARIGGYLKSIRKKPW
jgi:hypothetical protein